MKTQDKPKNQTGFGLIQVAIVLTIVGALASFMMKPLAPVNPSKSNELALQKADKLLNDFIATNGRLPCVDTNADGVEDCAVNSAKGGLPYLTLGLTANAFTVGDAPIRYGVYRSVNDTAVNNGGIGRTGSVGLLANDADLAVLKNRYQPTMAGGFTFDFTEAANLNELDFCQALEKADTNAFSASQLYVQTASGAQKNVAYAISIGGQIDSDNDGSINDGLNANSTVAFNSSGTLLTSAYDDYVISRSFTDLQDKMQCDVVIQSLNMIANSVLLEKEVKDQAEALATKAVEGSIMAGINVAVIAYSTVLAGVNLANAIATTSVASGLLSGAIASCIVLVGCAFIPVYTASVVAGALGVTLGGVAVGAGVAAGIAQAVSTGKYIDIAIKSNAAIPPEVSANTAEPDYSSMQADLQAKYNDANSKAVTARTAANTAQTSANVVKNNAEIRFTTLYANSLAWSDKGAGSYPDTYPNKTAYDAKIAVLKAQAEAYQTALDNELTALNDYRAKEQAAAGVKEDCENTSCVFDPPLTQADIDALPPGGTAADLPACPAGGTADQTSAPCIEYAEKLLAQNAAYTVYLNARTASDTAYNNAIQAAKDHPVYVPEVRNAENEVTSVATTTTCEAVGCSLISEVSYAMGDVPKYHLTGALKTWQLLGTPPIQYWGYDYDSVTYQNSYMEAILIYQADADTLEIDAIAQEASLADILESLTVVNCKQAGKFWDDSNDVCLDTPPPGSSSGTTFSQGGSNILKEADSQGIFQ